MGKKQDVDAIKKMIIGSVISELGLLEIVDKTTFDLKHRVKGAIRACNHVQDYYRKDPDSSEETKSMFKEEFLSGKWVLIAEILVSLWELNEDDIEEIMNQIKAATDEQISGPDVEQ